jgi:hypothetical protein
LTREQNVAAPTAAIRKLIEVLIARDQGMIGAHEDTTRAQAALVDALRAVLGAKIEERADG